LGALFLGLVGHLLPGLAKEITAPWENQSQEHQAQAQTKRSHHVHLIKFANNSLV
jgi:hypothetical protein